MRTLGVLPATAALAILLPACEGGPSHAPSPDAEAADSPIPEPDAATSETEDAEPDTAAEPDAPAPTRLWTYRALGGMSMGAVAANIALRDPGLVDVVGALGGYMDLRYMVTTGIRSQLGGFCPLETLEENLGSLNDPAAAPPVFCGPVPAGEELEHVQDFNHMHYSENGAAFTREFYIRVFQGLTMAYGNFTAPPVGTNPYLPTGVDLEEFSAKCDAERCANPTPIPKELSYNAEYNPEAAYPVIEVCDGEEQVTPALGGADFDPAVKYTTSFDVALAVDLNRNGRRDYAEPLFVNAFERFEDTGADGCPSPREDGAGGCLDPGLPDAAGDPNGDDFHWWENSFGREGNRWRDEGEPYLDLGLDGVAGSGDAGEDNGTYDLSPAFERALEYDATTLVESIPKEDLERLDFWFDAGIRDPLNAAVSTRHVAGALHARGEEVVHYGGLVGRPGALFPDMADVDVLDLVFTQDLSPAAIGRHVYVEYGNPAATPEEIAEGDGGHVGTNLQAVNRITSFLVFAAKRFPDPDQEPGFPTQSPAAEYHHFYSEALQARRSYTVALPPGYDATENRYPVVHFLHGLGQTASDLAPAALATSFLMQDGTLPKVILSFVDGACCDVHLPTGRRECACRVHKKGERACVDPDCEGPEETCEVRILPSSELDEECNEGSLFFDLVANKWAEPRDDLGYMTSVYEAIEDVDQKFRTRTPELR